MAKVLKNQSGDNNPNWRGGTSGVHYKNHHRRDGAISANRKVQRAVKSGKLVRLPCEICGDLITEAHHDDYNKPFAVRWLCKRHHNQADRGMI